MVSIDSLIKEHTQVALGLAGKSRELEAFAAAMIQTLKSGNKVLICGNGGSAADAQHFATELTGRFIRERRALPAIALTTDSSALTAISNDYGFKSVFARQVEALGKKGDLLLLLSTSGESENLLEAAKAAKILGMPVFALLGKDGGKLRPLCERSIVVASDRSPRIQEMHTFMIHCICELVDEAFAKLD
jgi:D-sedoheptulose 7-phosphate isomerase